MLFHTHTHTQTSKPALNKGANNPLKSDSEVLNYI